MRRFLVVLLAAATLPIASAQVTDDGCVRAQGSARAEVRADRAILFLTVRSNAPIASEAVAKNQSKAKEIQAALAKLGLAEMARFTATRLGSVGQPHYGPGPRPESTAGYEAVQFLYVTFAGKDFADRDAFETRIANTIDELRRAGASVYDGPVNRVCQQNLCSVAFTLGDPAAVTGRLIPQATRNARRVAEELAAAAGVKLGQLRSAQVNSPMAGAFVGHGMMGPIDDLALDFVSPTENIPLVVNVSVLYEVHAGSDTK
jgi:uncharacterized protein YggE